jgi:hypothetical protein
VWPLLVADIQWAMSRRPPTTWEEAQNYTFLMFMASLGPRRDSIVSNHQYFQGIKWKNIRIRRTIAPISIPPAYIPSSPEEKAAVEILQRESGIALLDPDVLAAYKENEIVDCQVRTIPTGASSP